MTIPKSVSLAKMFTIQQLLETELCTGGIVSSEEPTFLVPDRGEENQSVEILRHRPDGTTYAGTLTFTATKPVDVGFGYRIHLDNSSQYNVIST